MGKKQLIVKNILYGFGTKLAIMAISFILPRLFITSFGSEINGLLSTITQIFTYLALLEAGIGNATINALYRPLDNGDRDRVNSVLSEARTYYRRVTVIYCLCVLGFAVFYPFFADSSLSRAWVTAIILLQGGASCISYYFSAAYMQLLTADGKQYLVDNINFAIHVASSVIKIILVYLGFNILAVQLGFFIISMLKCPLIIWICKKRYGWLALRKTKTCESIKERGAFVIHEVSTVIFMNTDIVIISAFCSFAAASVYSVYNLVFAALNTMINTANAGLGFILGQNHYKDQEYFRRLYDCYSFAYSFIVFVVMTVAYIMITPFVRLYTKGVTDIDYVMAGIPLLFTVINIMSGVRAVASRLIAVSGHAEKTSMRSVAEMIINLAASLVLVNAVGLHGVLYGTIIALVYRMNDIIIYANRKILMRSPLREYRRLLIYGLTFGMCILISLMFDMNAESYIGLAGKAFITGISVAALYGGVSVFACRSEISQLKAIIRH